jgi:glutamine amidotransferase
MLPDIETDRRFATRRFQRVGDTDSEHAFCALLARLAPVWEHGTPTVDERLDALTMFARDLRDLGPANFVYSDGDAVFAHAHRRRNDAGEIRPPGLHLLCRHCAAAEDGVPLAGLSMPEAPQDIALIASVPLSAEAWTPLAEGTLVVLREGRVVSTAAA